MRTYYRLGNRSIARVMIGVAGVALTFGAAIIALAPSVKSQTYPVNNPTYLPNGILAVQTLAATGALTYQNNGNGTMIVRVAGTFTGLVAAMQVTEQRGGTPTWTTVSVEEIGAARKASITGTGLYRLNVAGTAQVRFNVTALSTGSVTAAFSAGAGQQFTQQLPAQRATYSASITGLATAASATDFFTLTGATGVVSRVNYVACSGIASTVGTADIVALKRSTANTGGTATAPTVVPNDSGSAAGGSAVAAYTANPTTGTLVGNVRVGKIGLPLANTGAINQTLAWTFGDRPGSQEMVLRAATAVFALNGAGATLAPGASLDCSIEWTEGE